MAAEEPGYVNTETAERLREQLRLLNLMFGFNIFILFVFIMIYASDWLGGLLAAMPYYAVAVALLMVIVLTIAGFIYSGMIQAAIVSSIEAYTGKLDDIFRVSHHVRTELDRSRLLDEVLGYALRMTRSNAGYILLAERGRFVMASAQGGGLEHCKGQGVPLMTGIGGDAFSQGRHVIIPEGNTDPDLSSTFSGETYKYKTLSALCVPMKNRRGVIGVIELLNTRAGGFDEGDVKLIGYLGDQAATALDMGRMYQALKMHAARDKARPDG